MNATEKFLAAHRFYEKNGFIELQKVALPKAFPIMAVDSKFYILGVSKGEAQGGRTLPTIELT